MRCLLDTNILISASMFPDGIAARAYFKAVTYPNHSIICDYSIDEMRRVYRKKFPQKMQLLESFITTLVVSVDVVATPSEEEAYPSEALIRDPCDRPILRAALKNHADVLLTGDKDFLQSDVAVPIMVECENGMAVFCPSLKDKEGEYRDVCFHITPEFRAQFNNVILNAYDEQALLNGSRISWMKCLQNWSG